MILTSDIFVKLKKNAISNIYSDVQTVLLQGGNTATLAMEVLKKLRIPAERQAMADDDLKKLVCLCCQSIALDYHHSSTIPTSTATISSLLLICDRLYHNPALMYCVDVLESCLPIVEKMVSSMPEAQLKLTGSFGNYLLNRLVSLNDETFLKDPFSDDKLSALSLWRLLLKAFLLVQSNPALPLKVLNKIILVYTSNYDNLKSEMISNVCKRLFDSYEEFCDSFSQRYQIEESSAKDLFSEIIRVQTILMSCFCKIKAPEAASCSISSLTVCVGKLCKSYPKYIEYWGLAVKVINVFDVLPKYSPTSNNVKSEIMVWCVESLQNYTKREKSKELDLVASLCVASMVLGNQLTNCDNLKCFDSSLLIPLQQFSTCLSEFILSGSYSLHCSERGKSTTNHKDFFRAFQALVVPVDVIHQKLSATFCEKQLNMLEDNLRKCERILRDATNQGCSNVQQMSRLFYNHSYWFVHLCKKANNWKKAEEYILKVLPYFVNKWQTEASRESFFPKPHIFSLLVLCYEKLKLHKKALVAILLPLILHSHLKYEPDSYCSSTWCNLQGKNSENVETSLQFISNNLELIESLCPSVCQIKIQKSHIVIWELKCYASFEISNFELVHQAWKALENLNTSPLITLEGAAYALRALVKNGHCHSELFDGFLNLNFTSIRQNITKEQYFETSKLLAFMTQSRALGLALRNAVENSEMVKSRPNMTEIPKMVEKPEDVPHLNDSCHVVVAAKKLNITRESEIMALLDQSVNYWEEAIRYLPAKKSDLAINFEHSTLLDLNEILMETAFIFTLFGHQKQAAKTWNVCRKYASKIGRDDLLLQALSGLMRTVECPQAWLAEADSLMLKLSCHPRSKHLLLYHHTSRALHALRTKNHEEGFAFLAKIHKDTLPVLSSLWCFINVKLLCASYALLPGSTKFVEQFSYDNPVCLAESGLRYALQQYKNNSNIWSAPTQLCPLADQLLSVSLWIGRIFCQIKQPREARAYLTAELEVAQKLGLASRVSEFLCELAQLDLICDKLDDAKLKINDVKSILEANIVEYTHGPSTNQLILAKNSSSLKEKCPSPTLIEPVCALPNQDHPIQCECYLCSNITIQLISVLLFKLQARVLTLQFNVHEAFSCYRSGLQLSKEQVKKLQKDKTIPGHLLLQHQIMCARIAMDIEYVDFLILYGKDAEAFSRNRRVISHIDDLNTAEVYLKAEAVEQKMCLLQIELDKQKSSLPVPSRKENQITPEKKTTNMIVKTPVNHFNPQPPRGPGKRRPLSSISTPNQEPLSPRINSEFADVLNKSQTTTVSGVRKPRTTTRQVRQK